MFSLSLVLLLDNYNADPLHLKPIYVASPLYGCQLLTLNFNYKDIPLPCS